MGDSQKLSMGLKPAAELLDSTLAQLYGDRVAFVLVVGTNADTLQYVANISRQTSMSMLADLLERWAEQETLGEPEPTFAAMLSKRSS